MTTTEPLLRLEGIRKSYGAVHALNGVDLEVRQGEVLALVGDNGAGKSTLVKTIAGAHAADAGRFLFEGSEVRIGSPQAAAELGIATVYQDLAICNNLDIVANLFLGREQVRAPLAGRLRRLSNAAMEQRTQQVLADLSVTTLTDLRRPVSGLSGGQRQAVAVARAVLWGSKLVLLDEPTAALGVEQTDMVLGLVRSLAERGLGVIVISHNLSDVFRVADRIAVLRLGRNAGTFVRAESEPDDIVSAITGGRLLSGAKA
ncbi:MAG TPA: ATP-binding cassette domain-containing protein [Conexibacter sp.]|nr:ATP-binding cassette domain-containing protein [Conexibacter sp.]